MNEPIMTLLAQRMRKECHLICINTLITMKNSIRVERAVVDISQQQLADAVGVSRQTINAIEKGRFVPSTVLALKIARHFNKKVDDIFILDDED